MLESPRDEEGVGAAEDDADADDDEEEQEGISYVHHHHRFVLQLFTKLNEWGYVTDSNTKDTDGMLQIPRQESAQKIQEWFRESFENGPELRAMLSRLLKLPVPKMYLRHEGQASTGEFNLPPPGLLLVYFFPATTTTSFLQRPLLLSCNDHYFSHHLVHRHFS
jgi:hypothetical protein